MRTIPFLVSIVFFAACNGPDDPHTGDTSTCQVDCDTDTAVQGHALVTFIADEDCQVRLTGEKAVSGRTNVAIDIDAPGTYNAKYGDDGVGDFPYPVCEGSDGRYRAALDFTFQVQDGDDVDEAFLETVLFEPGQYACEYEEYAYDAGAVDFKGVSRGNHPIDLLDILIGQDGVVSPQGNPNLNVVGDGDDLIAIDGDQIVLTELNGANGVHITRSEIGNDSFTLTVVSPNWPSFVADLTCLRQ